MTKDTSPKNLRKFLESDDLALVRMGLSMAKGSGVPEELLPTILGLYMWDDDKSMRAAAKSVFNKHAPLDIKDKIKELWKPQYRNKLFIDNWEKVPFIHHFDSNYHDLLGTHWVKKAQANWVKLTDDFQKIILFYETFQSQEELACIILDPLIYFLGYEEFEDFEHNPVTHVWMDDGTNIFEHPIIISAIKTLIGYGLVKSSRSSRLHRKEILPKHKRKVVRKNVAFILGWADKRLTVAKALGKIGDGRKIEPLIELLEDKSVYVRRTATQALEKLGWKPETDELRITLLLDKGDLDGCSKLGESAVEPLIKALNDGFRMHWDGIYDSGWRSEKAGKVLGEIGDTRAVEPLIKALSDDAKDVRESAAEALGKIGDARAVEPLILTIDANKKDTWKAAEALGKIGDVRAVDCLIKVFTTYEKCGYHRGILRDTKKTLQNIGWLGSYALFVNEENSEFLTHEPITNSELKQILKKKGLPISGKKEDLIKRLKGGE